MATKKSVPSQETPTTAKSPAAAKSAQPARTKAPKAAAAPSSPVKEPAAKKSVPAKQAVPAALSVAPAPVKPVPKAPKAAAAPATKPAAAPSAEPQDKWSEIRALLLKMKQEALQEIARSIKSGSESSAADETSGDIYDQASSERDRELELLLNDREREKLHNIDEALLRMAEGDYGLCEECDEDIPVGRLKVLPFTRHCVKCKSDLERIQAQTRWVDDTRAYREIPNGDEDE
ncbi:TraR/DksA family transcriptional regulator [Trichlorobacter ammonificans]|uniref:Transcriptional regulator, TraR/DksA family n=1 Tax=Trichlorobacter ammonificans TaxID=2916410 RepID=A0ABM9D546_9BACT|nr:TraR/DksA C4-type zinc finger protein [Trichlorobacter ammonificans]CAH2029835.1 Transcriptional regulator, TraR/DksA family [Trichlorobacter ammonificans]